MNGVNETDDIMREQFQEHFVDLSNVRAAADRVSEFPLYRGERGFYVAAFVVVGQKFLALEIVVVEQLVPCRILHARLHLGIIAERDEGRDAHLVDMRDHIATAVRFVGGDFDHIEVLRGLLKQGLELGDVVAVAVGYGRGSDDMRLDADHRVNLDVVAHIDFVPVLRGVVAIEALQSEASRIAAKSDSTARSGRLLVVMRL